MAHVSQFDRIPLPKDLAGAIDTLRHALFAEGLPVYALFDPLLGLHIERHRSGDGPVPAKHVLSLAQWGIPAGSSPYFVRIERPLSRLLDETVAVAKRESDSIADARSVCGWFTSPHEPDALRNALLKQIGQREASGKRWIFRFYDPRALQHLPRVLGSSFAVAGISRWFFLGANLDLCSLSGLPETDRPMVVGEGNLALLDRIGLVNQALAQWRRIDPSAPKDGFDLLFEAADQAIRCGLDIDQTADCVSFMLHRCLLHPYIERHPLVASWLEDARQGRRSYVDAAAAAPQAVWDDITMGRWTEARHGVHHG